jgi:hypothetical protein
VSGPRRSVTAPRVAALLLAAGILTAGCGAAQAAHPAATRATMAPPSLTTSLITATGTWAVVPMGGSPAFWQLLRYPAQGRGWSLVTPPGVADNGGLVLADRGGQSLVAGFRPSQALAFSPLATTEDGGKSWSPGILDAALADVPDALAAGAGGHLLAVLSDGMAEESAGGTSSGWSALTSRDALAASRAGRTCDLRALTAAAFSPSGIPLLAGTCARPGTAGIFAAAAGPGGRTWHAVGPALPRSLAGGAVSTLRLATIGGRTVALLSAGTGPAERVLAAWTGDGGAHWTLAPPLSLGGAQVQSSGLGARGAVWLTLSSGRAETISASGGSWRALPASPPGTAGLTLGSSGQVDALVTDGTKLTDWRLDVHATAWHIAQIINVPIQFGSSG